MKTENPLLILMGPTASGKTTLALDLGQAFKHGAECISADSMQVYQGMDIGTATPTADEQATFPHHLLNVANPHESGFTVYEWLRRTEEAIDAIRARGAVPIVVGGTNLYIRALLEGVTQGTPVEHSLRAELEALETDALRQELLQVDPVAAERIHTNDRRRTIRALEVFRTTGTPLSQQQQQWSDDTIAPRSDAILICMDWPTEPLNRRINARVKTMMEEGFLDEVRALLAHGPLGEQAAEAVGYRELTAHLAGTLSLEDAIEQIKIRSRRLAKQQRTWMRRFRAIPGALTLTCGPEPTDQPNPGPVLTHLEKSTTIDQVL